MKSPAYHLRPNKSAERFAFIEAIRHLIKLSGGIDEYTYFGLGGPYLEDCRLLYEFYPELSMVSVEEREEVLKRQQFHLPCGTLHLEPNSMKSFIIQYQPGDNKSIFWLDYTRLEYECFDDFKILLDKIPGKSMIKITLRAEPDDFWDEYKVLRPDKADEFRKMFGQIMPDATADPPRDSKELAHLLQEMLQITAQQALPGDVTSLMFQPVSSFYYSDGTGMFTLTGMICERDGKEDIINAFEDWEFANFSWEEPYLIDVPILSTKERLNLQHLLPCKEDRGSTLLTKLGYLIDEDVKNTENALEQYAAFHRYFPYFMRGTP